MVLNFQNPFTVELIIIFVICLSPGKNINEYYSFYIIILLQ